MGWFSKKRKESFRLDAVSVRIMMMIDTSASMNYLLEGSNKSRLEASKEELLCFAKKRYNEFKNDELISMSLGVVSFSANSLVILPLTKIDEAVCMLPDVLSRICSGCGGTNHIHGMNCCVSEFNQKETQKSYPDTGFVDVIVILTDGEHNGEGNPVETAIHLRFECNTLIYTIGIGDSVSEKSKYYSSQKNLQLMSSVVDGQEWYSPVSTQGDLTSCFDAIAKNLVERT